jgi:membrane-associated PAP2 superfamily phosphatase
MAVTRPLPIPHRASAPLLLPLVVLVLGSLLLGWWDLDRRVQAWFFEPEQGWWLTSNPAVLLLYRYGTWPAIAVASLAGVTWAGSWWVRRWRGRRAVAGFLVWLILLGPWLLVNSVFKDYFGRPRPRQVVAYGGDLPYAPLGSPHWGGMGKSFPSGHAAMGFYWLGLFVFYWSRRRRLAWGFFGLGMLHGSLMGFGRLAQGGHWLSDVFWAAGFVYLTAWVLCRFLPQAAPDCVPGEAGGADAGAGGVAPPETAGH